MLPRSQYTTTSNMEGTEIVVVIKCSFAMCRVSRTEMEYSNTVCIGDGFVNVSF